MNFKDMILTYCELKGVNIFIVFLSSDIDFPYLNLKVENDRIIYD